MNNNKIPNNCGNSVSLQSILEVFHIGIKEEQSWALIYNTCLSLIDIINNNTKQIYIMPLDSAQNLFIQTNGNIDSKTWVQSTNLTPIKCIIESIEELFIEALDFGCDVNYERILTPALESVINIMITADEVINNDIIIDDD